MERLQRHTKLNDRVTFPFELRIVPEAREPGAGGGRGEEGEGRRLKKKSGGGDCGGVGGQHTSHHDHVMRQGCGTEGEGAAVDKTGRPLPGMPNTGGNVCYNLFAVVVHVGDGPHHGHYIVLAKTHGIWLMIDDHVIQEIEERDVTTFFGGHQGSSDAGYILFYQSETVYDHR